MTLTSHSKIYGAGHTGLVGSALVRRLEAAGYSNLVVRARADAPDDRCLNRLARSSMRWSSWTTPAPNVPGRSPPPERG